MAYSCFLKILTFNVIVVSIAMFALGIANVSVVCSGDGNPCMSMDNQYLIWTASYVYFLAVGIWASIPCLLSGLGTWRAMNKPSAGKNWLWLTVATSALVFTPIMILFSAFNATSVQTMINNLPSGTATPSRMTVSFALPLTIAILAFLVHLHLLLIWCAGCQMDEETVTVVEVPKVLPPQPVPEPVLRSTAWHVSAPAAHCGCNHYAQNPYGR